MENPEDFWRKHINDLSNSLPDEGLPAPDLESMAVVKKKKPIKDGTRKVLVQKILTCVYVFTDTNGKMYTSNARQNMHILGTMTLEQALKRAQEDDSFT